MSNQNQEYELELPIKQPYNHSVKLEETSKGVRISVHVYGNSSEEARQQVLKTYLGVEHDLKSHMIKLAPIHTGKEVYGGKTDE